MKSSLHQFLVIFSEEVKTISAKKAVMKNFKAITIPKGEIF
jgi:hypothetical protein